ncbi:MAG: UPF0280 family protein [Alphaproteobacteria bacterium]|nr:UPF0280 family protein [Alphaproteobacteria bacterium]
MAGGPVAALLPDGRRLHLQHGPIDLVIEAFGAPDEIAAAYRQAVARFADILPTLVAELPALRTPLAEPRWQPEGPVARRMVAACWPYRDRLVTPMAAVAGAVADEMIAALVGGRTLSRAYVNNGGDIAIYLAPGEELRLGVVGDIDNPSIDTTARLTAALPIRGIATSGWSGRSFSLGIADAVTVLADDAAAADAAATMIANATAIDHPAIARAPASTIELDSDLGDRLVTVSVGALDARSIEEALGQGAAEADRLRRAGLVTGAVLVLKRRYRVVGTVPAALDNGGER